MSDPTTPPVLPIIGLIKDITDPETGSKATYSVVVAYHVNLQYGGSAMVVFGSYVSREAQESGKRHLAMVTVQLKVAPTGDSALWPHWFAEQVLADPEGNPLTGATPVRAAPAEPTTASEEPAA